MRVALAVVVCACHVNDQPVLPADAAGKPGDAAQPPHDALPPDASIECNILTQTGCPIGLRCGWVMDGPQTGHVGCVPNGNAAVGEACSYLLPPQGYDNCMIWSACIHGVCEQICDSLGGPPACDAQHGCVLYQGFLDHNAGMCDRACDPLADNYFGKPSRAGATCQPLEGCYGMWNPTRPSFFFCVQSPPFATMLYHRSTCGQAAGCVDPSGQPYLNGCASGYIPYISDDLTGGNTYVCSAFCKPADCYLGHCGTSNANAIGAAPHRCSGSDAAGTFDGSADGDQCVYGWYFERDASGSVLRSPYSDTTGLCIDHSHMHLEDPTGTMPSQTPWPACSTLKLTPTGTRCDSGDQTGCSAVTFGCVSTTTGGVQTHFAPLLRAPYH